MYIGTSEKGLTKEIKIPMPWGFVAAKTWGLETNSPVLCLHGWLDNANTFDTLIPLLPKDFFYVCIDIPGQGISSHLPPGMFYMKHNHVNAFYYILQFFGWKRVNLMGHSLGGYYCIQFAFYFPDIIDKLIVLDVSYPVTTDTRISISLKNTRTRIENNVKLDHQTFKARIQAVESVIKRNLKRIPDLTEKAVEILLQRETINGMHTSHVDPRQKTLHEINLVSTKDTPVFINMIKAEVLHIFATHGLIYEESDLPESRDYYLSLFKSSPVKKIDGNHFMHLCQPEKVANYITEMLRRPSRKDLKPIKHIKSKL